MNGGIMDLSKGAGIFYLPSKSRYSALNVTPFDKVGKAQDNGSLIGDNFMPTNDEFGVYALVFHTDDGEKIYIGSTSRSFTARYRRHLSDLRSVNHSNSYLQHLYGKYGNPEFKIIEICTDREQVAVREQWHIDQTDKKILVNLGPALPNPMAGRHLHHTKETKERISRTLKGKVFSPETCAKISQAKMGHSVSEETRKKMSKERKGKPGHPSSPETNLKISQANKGHKFTDETKAIMSKNRKGRIPWNKGKRHGRSG